MKTNITKEDVLNLRKELLDYAEKAEQHFFPLIALVHKKIDFTIEVFDTVPIEELNSMFRVVYKVIGKDFSEYKSC